MRRRDLETCAPAPPLSQTLGRTVSFEEHYALLQIQPSDSKCGTCESFSSPLSSLQNALSGSPDTKTKARVPLQWNMYTRRLASGIVCMLASGTRCRVIGSAHSGRPSSLSTSAMAFWGGEKRTPPTSNTTAFIAINYVLADSADLGGSKMAHLPDDELPSEFDVVIDGTGKTWTPEVDLV